MMAKIERAFIIKNLIVIVIIIIILIMLKISTVKAIILIMLNNGKLDDNKIFFIRR